MKYLPCKFIAFSLSVLFVAGSSLAFAGTDFVKAMPAESNGKCTQSGNTMSCTGSFRAIRAQQADPNRWANVSITNTASSIHMMYSGVSYNCVAPNNQAWKDAFLAAISSSYFTVSYDVNTGVCSSINAFDGSQFRNPSSL